MTRQQILRYAKRVLLSLCGLVRLLPILCCKDTINFYIYNHFLKKNSFYAAKSLPLRY